jgi:hypothetical protein
MKGIDMKETNCRAFRGVAWVGKAVLFCLGLLTILALSISGYRSAASSPSGVPSSNPLIQHGTL